MAGAPKGNKNAAKSRMVSDLLRKLLIQNDQKRLHNLCDKAVTLAEEGDREMIKFVTERAEGKVKDEIEMTGEDGSPLLTGIQVVFMKSDGTPIGRQED